jgi:hypothetical protein
MANRTVVKAHLEDAIRTLRKRDNPGGTVGDLEQFKKHEHDRRRLLERVMDCRENRFSEDEIAEIIGEELFAACDASDDEPR